MLLTADAGIWGLAMATCYASKHGFQMQESSSQKSSMKAEGFSTRRASAKTLIDGHTWVLEQSKRGEVFRKQFPVTPVRSTRAYRTSGASSRSSTRYPGANEDTQDHLPSTEPEKAAPAIAETAADCA